MRRNIFWRFLLCVLVGGVLIGCAPGAQSPAPGGGSGPLRVLATTSIVADVVEQVGGEAIGLTTLLPPGADPHSFEPAPQDITEVSQAQVLFANGADLEVFLEKLIESAGAQEKVIHVSEGVSLRTLADEDPGGEEEHEYEGGDPHTWTDPNNVLIWVDNIERRLSALDPEHASIYRANAAAYKSELSELDAWIASQAGLVPEARRVLVSDHRTLGYFADRYGFTQVGALIPSYSSLAEPSAQELAALEDAIQSYQVPAIFVGNTLNLDLAQRVSEDTGVRLVFIYSGSLSEPGGEADSYLEYMRYNTNAIVNALTVP